jgi:hypothetical protein
VSDEPDPPGGDQERSELLARLRVVAEAKDAERTPAVPPVRGTNRQERLGTRLGLGAPVTNCPAGAAEATDASPSPRTADGGGHRSR